MQASKKAPQSRKTGFGLGCDIPAVMSKLNEVSSNGKSLEQETDQWQSKQVIRSLTMRSQNGLKTKAHRIVIFQMSKFVRWGSKKCG